MPYALCTQGWRHFIAIITFDLNIAEFKRKLIRNGEEYFCEANAILVCKLQVPYIYKNETLQYVGFLGNLG